MKIVAISDIHGFHPVLPEGDVLVVAGDITRRGLEYEYSLFSDYLDKQSFKHIIVIGGNHDEWIEESSNKRIQDKFSSNVTYLNNSQVVIDNLVFYGSPITPVFGYWSFMQGKHEIKKTWEKIPDNVNVLITHGPPKGILDNNLRLNPCGCPALLDRLQNINPKVHIFGHIHEGYGSTKAGKTKFYNVAIMDVFYKPVNKPTVIEI